MWLTCFTSELVKNVTNVTNVTMPKNNFFETGPEKRDDMVITIDPAEIEKRVRKPLPPPSRFHKDKSKYERKPKHGQDFNNE